MAVQVSVKSAGKVTFVGTTSCVKVGATAEPDGRREYCMRDLHNTVPTAI